MTDPAWESRFRQAVQGLVEAGVAVRANTSELWAEIRGAAAEAGLEIGPAGFALVNQMRGEAAARRSGYETFQAADTDVLFTPDMAAPESNVRSLVSRALQPEYLARFDMTFIGPDGTEQTRTVSLRDVWRPDMTVGDVHDAVADAAEGLGNEYGQGLVGFSNIRPVAI